MIKRLLLVLIVVITSLLVIWKLNFFTVNFVKVVSNAGCASEEAIQKETSLLGQNFINFDTEKIKKNIKNKYLCIKEVEIKYEFPKTIIIYCYSRNFLSKIIPLGDTLQMKSFEASDSSEAALIDLSFPESSGEVSMIVDDTGFIFKKEEGENLPVIFSDTSVSLGEQLNPEIFQKISVVLKKLTGSFNSFLENNPRLKLIQGYIVVDGPFIIIFDTKRDILKQLASLQLILQEAKINQGTLRSIDLRFDKPIVTYQAK